MNDFCKNYFEKATIKIRFCCIWLSNFFSKGVSFKGSGGSTPVRECKRIFGFMKSGGLTLDTSSLKSLCGGQITSSTMLIKPNMFSVSTLT